MITALHESVLVWFASCQEATATVQKSFVKNFCSKCDQICWKLRIWSHFTEEIINRKLHFLCSVCNIKKLKLLTMNNHFLLSVCLPFPLKSTNFICIFGNYSCQEIKGPQKCHSQLLCCYNWFWIPAQLLFTCLKITIETLENSVKYAQN